MITLADWITIVLLTIVSGAIVYMLYQISLREPFFRWYVIKDFKYKGRRFSFDTVHKFELQWNHPARIKSINDKFFVVLDDPEANEDSRWYVSANDTKTLKRKLLQDIVFFYDMGRMFSGCREFCHYLQENLKEITHE